MQVVELPLSGLKLIKPKVFKDNRGFFLESYQQLPYEQAGIDCNFSQDNHSYSQKNCIRGMHFQSFPGQAKLVRVGVGKIFDVAVDIRPESPTFKQWFGVELDDQNHHQLFIPVGFAHGFCVLSDEAHVFYKVSTPYDSQTEIGFRFNDEEIAIEWPTKNPILSERDMKAPSFQEISQLKVCLR